MLRILHEGEVVASTKMITSTHLLSVLPQGILPITEWHEDGRWAGKIKKIFPSKSNKAIFTYTFDSAVRCSSADMTLHFENVHIENETKLKIEHSYSIKRNVAWSFYSLEIDPDDPLDNYFVNNEHKYLRDNLILRVPNDESERMDCLLLCITRHYKKVKVSNVKAITQTDHYCEFTGGGDLLVEFPSCLSHLVITEGSKEGNNLSPIHKGTSRSSTSIEGKKESFPYSKLEG